MVEWNLLQRDINKNIPSIKWRDKSFDHDNTTCSTFLLLSRDLISINKIRFELLSLFATRILLNFKYIRWKVPWRNISIFFTLSCDPIFCNILNTYCHLVETRNLTYFPYVIYWGASQDHLYNYTVNKDDP